MLNKIVIAGRCAANPELRTAQSGTEICNVTLAVDRDFKDKASGEKLTDWVPVVAFGKTATFLNSYFSKGRVAIVDGRLQIRNWEDNDGNKHRIAEVVADNIYFGDSKKDDSGASTGSSDKPKTVTTKKPSPSPVEDEDYDSDQDLPF